MAPPVTLTVSNSSSRTITISGDEQFSVDSTNPSDTTVICINLSFSPGGFVAVTTVAGTMTDANSRTFPYEYTVTCSFYSEGGDR